MGVEEICCTFLVAPQFQVHYMSIANDFAVVRIVVFDSVSTTDPAPPTFGPPPPLAP